MTDKKETDPGVSRELRQQAEAALRESIANFGAVLNATDESIYLIAVDKTVLALNDMAARSLGRSRRELIGKNLRDLLPPEIIARRRPFIDRLISTGEPVIFEDEKDGRWTVNHLYPVRDADGHVVSMAIYGRDITERKKREEALQHSLIEAEAIRAQYELTASMISDIVWRYEVDAQGRFVRSYISPAADGLLGLPAGTIGESFEKYFAYAHPDDLAIVQAMLFEGLHGRRKKMELEYRLVKPDGTVVWVRSRGSALGAEGGGVVGFGTTADITDHRRAIELSCAQRDLAQALSEATSLDAAMNLCLDAALRITGMDAGGIYLADKISGDLDLVAYEGLSPAYIACVAHYPADSASARLVRAGRPIYSRHQDLGVPLRDAQRREGLRAAAVIPVLHERQVTACLNLASHHLDEFPAAMMRPALESIVAQIGGAIVRLRAGQALRESERRFREMLENVELIAVMLDPEGRITFCNDFLLNFTGYSRADVLGQDWFAMFIPPELGIKEVFQNTVQSGTFPAHFENDILTAAGKRCTISWSNTVVRDADGRVMGTTSIGEDITARKRAGSEKETALKEARRAEKELQDKNFELNRFTSAVLHDLRGPLVTIQAFQGHLERDIKGQDAARVSEDLGFIRNAADKIGRLLDDLRRFIRVGRIMNLSEETPLQEIVREALDLLAGRIRARGVRIDLTEAPIVLYGDRMRLVEVYLNLVDNAVKFMGDEPAPRVEIGAEQAEEGIVLLVRDNGIGVEPELQPLVFDMFRKLRLDSEGEGIGLALARRIVELHGGRIWISSEGSGKGATFRFTLAKTRRRRDAEKTP